MTWRTHVAVGVNALWVSNFFGNDQQILILLPAAVIASLLPDTDSTSAKIHYVGGGLMSAFKGTSHGKYFHHRGIMHSFFVTGLFFAVSWLLFKNTIPALPYVIALSYLSHPIIDGFNTKVGYFYPFSRKRFMLFPWHNKVGGSLDTIFMILGLFGILLFFLLFAQKLQTQLLF